MQLKKTKSLITFIILAFSWLFPIRAQAINKEEDKNIIKSTVESLISSDYNIIGDSDARIYRSKYSKEHYKNEEMLGWERIQLRYAYPVDVKCFYLVNSWTIKNIEHDKDRAKAYVDFDCVATGRFNKSKQCFEYEKMRSAKDTQVIDLVKEDGKWFINQPPLPRISIKAHIREIEDEMARKESLLKNITSQRSKAGASKKTIEAVEKTIATKKDELSRINAILKNKN